MVSKYYEFREKLFEILHQADDAYARMQKLVRVQQNRDKYISDYMNIVCLLVFSAYRKIKHKKRQNILIFYLTGGVNDSRLALYICTISLATAGKAERMAI